MLKAAATRLRTIRKSRGLTLAESAKLLGLSEAWLSRVERAHIDSISVDLAFRIQDVFGIPIETWRAKDRKAA